MVINGTGIHTHTLHHNLGSKPFLVLTKHIVRKVSMEILRKGLYIKGIKTININKDS